MVKGTDMGGKEGGQSGTGTVFIKVLDINDNVPTLEQTEVRDRERQPFVPFAEFLDKSINTAM